MTQHLLTYPTVQEGVRMFQATSVGKMSLQLTNAAYEAGAPLLSYFDKPYKYVSPYVERVDQFGNETLSRVEERFPAVKKPYPELLDEAKSSVYAPAAHIGKVYDVMCQRTPGENTVAHGKAAFKTVAVVTAQGLRIGVQKVHESLDTAMKDVDSAIAANNTSTNGEDASPKAQGQAREELEPKSASA